MHSRHIAELDGIRGLAVLAVLVFHFSGEFGPGWCGVDLFFVLSGFLITGILVDSRDRRHYFRSFYFRRVLRIFPLYYAVVLLVFWAVLPFATPQNWLQGFSVLRSSDQIWYWLYLSNWKTVWDYGGPINHFWSLAIEEQFYLMWPLLVWCLSRRRLLAVCSAVVAVSFVARNMPAAVATQAIAGDFLYRLTPFRLDGLAAGAVVALLVRDERITGCLTRWSGWLAGGTSCLPLAVMACLGTAGPHSVGMARFGYSAFALSFAALVLYAATHAGAAAPLPVLLRCGFLRSFGRYSYAIYIFHWLFTSYVRGFAAMLLPGCSTVLSIVAGAAISWSLAWCSWHAFESRFLALKDRMDTVGGPVNQRLPEPLFTP